MKIAWVGCNVERQGDRLYSSSASVRYRLIIPAQALIARGHDVRVLALGPDTGLEQAASDLAGDVVVFSKLIPPDPAAFGQMSRLTFDLVRKAREKGMRTIADISDDHFEHPRHGDHFRSLVQACDLVVASTSGIADVIRSHTARPIHIAGDPCEGVERSPRFQPPPRRAAGLLSGVVQSLVGGGPRPLRLLWFVRGGNLRPALERVPQLGRLRHRHALELHLVTSADTNAGEICEQFNRDHPSLCGLRFSPWSLETMWRALEECDLVIIPSRTDDAAKAVESPNRMMESIRAGRFVCANPVPAYQAFDAFAWVAPDVVSGIEWALDHPREVVRKIEAGQRQVAGQFAPVAIAQQWESAFAAAGLSQNAPSRDGKTVKLNIGCGDKILPGYINVDVAENRAGVRPDVLCDLHRLSPFEDGCADEVLAVHVIEHFWRWETVDLLREWARVLKPGGRLILECPNLISACEEFLRDPDTRAGPGPEGQRTMWVFYGDPAWRDPLMVHRWGYTPDSLAQVMAEAGLTHIRQEPARFKLREPRDMRMVGERPA